jgi:hypothetical protein
MPCLTTIRGLEDGSPQTDRKAKVSRKSDIRDIVE